MIYTDRLYNIEHERLGTAVMPLQYDLLHTNAQNRSRVHSLDESYEGESRAAHHKPFGALRCCCLEEVFYKEESRREGTVQDSREYILQTSVNRHRFICVLVYIRSFFQNTKVFLHRYLSLNVSLLHVDHNNHSSE